VTSLGVQEKHLVPCLQFRNQFLLRRDSPSSTAGHPGRFSACYVSINSERHVVLASPQFEFQRRSEHLKKSWKRHEEFMKVISSAET